MGSGLWGIGPYPVADSPDAEITENERGRDYHLRSMGEVTGYHIQATDDELGHVEDFLVDDESWQIRYMVVDTKGLWLGKKVLVSPEWVERVDWRQRSVAVGLSRHQIKNAPEWDGNLPVDPAYDANLQTHYRRSRYPSKSTDFDT